MQTQTIARLVLMLVKLKRSRGPDTAARAGPILVTAGANVAVDNILRRLIRENDKLETGKQLDKRDLLRVRQTS